MFSISCLNGKSRHISGLNVLKETFRLLEAFKPSCRKVVMNSSFSVTGRAGLHRTPALPWYHTTNILLSSLEARTLLDVEMLDVLHLNEISALLLNWPGKEIRKTFRHSLIFNLQIQIYTRILQMIVFSAKSELSAVNLTRHWKTKMLQLASICVKAKAATLLKIKQLLSSSKSHAHLFLCCEFIA